ncbi:MAG: hypothetical protein AB7F50_09465 [Fimbriimonadaceae bacterium]
MPTPLVRSEAREDICGVWAELIVQPLQNEVCIMDMRRDELVKPGSMTKILRKSAAGYEVCRTEGGQGSAALSDGRGQGPRFEAARKP